MASNSIFDYVSNVAKSVKFAAIESVKETMPVTANFVDQNKETVKELYKDIIGSKSTIPRLNAVQDNVIFRNVNKMFNNIKTDLSTGQFYHPEREDMMANMSALSGLMAGMGGMGDDFMNELNAIFSGDFGEDSEDETGQPIERPEMRVTKGDALVASAFFRSQSTATNCIGKLMTRLHDHGTKSTRAIANMQFAQSQRSMLVNQAGFKTMTEGFNRVIDFNNQVMRVHVENSKKFYEDVSNTLHETNAIIKSIHAIQKKVYEGQFKKDTPEAEDPMKGTDALNFNEIFKNGFNLAAYKKLVKQNVQKSPTGMLYQISTFLPLMMQNMVNNPLGALSQSIIHGLMGGQMEWAMKKLDDTIAGAFSTALARLYDYGKKSGTGMLGSIAKMLGYKQERKSLNSIDTSKYFKEAMSWNGVAQKALVDVIPSYLARIEAATTGNGERYFDFHGSGKWQGAKQIKNTVRELERKSAKEGTKDVNPYVESVIRQMNFSKNEKTNRRQQREMRKNWEKIQEGIVKRGTIDFKDMLDYPDKYGTSPEMINIFAAILRSLGQAHPGQLMKATNSIALANQNYNEALSNMSVNTGGSLVPLLTNGLNGEVLKKKGFNPNNMKLPPVLNDLTQLKDNRGNTLYDYQYAILRELIGIKDSGGGFSGGNGPGGSSGPGNRNIDNVLNNIKSTSDYDDRSSKQTNTKTNTITNETRKELSISSQLKTSTGKYNDAYRPIYVNMDQLLDPTDKKGKKMLAHAINRVQDRYTRTNINANSGFFNFLSMDRRDPSKYHRLPDGIDENMPITEQLLKAADVGQKFDVIRHNIDALVDAPSSVFTSLIGKADQAVYDLLYGRPTGEVDPTTGRPINGIFEKIMSELNRNFGGLNENLDLMINKVKNLFGDDGALAFVKNKLKDFGFDLDPILNKAKETARNGIDRGLHTAGAAAREHARSVANAFTETFKDIGIIGASGRFDFNAINPLHSDEQPSGHAKGTKFFGGNKGLTQWAILSKGEKVVPPQDNVAAKAMGFNNYGMGTDYVKSTGLYPLAVGSRVVNARDNLDNPNRATADLNRDERSENTVRNAMKQGNFKFANFLPGFAKGSKFVGGKANDILKKLNKQGTDLTAEDINALMNAPNQDARLTVVRQILDKHINEGLFDDDRNDSRKKKMIFQIENLMKSFNYQKTNKQNFYMNAMGVQKDAKGNMVLGTKADKDKIKHLTDKDALEQKSYLELRDIRESLDALGEEQIDSDENIAKGKFAKKQGPVTGFRQFVNAAFGTDPKKAAEYSGEYIKKNSKSLVSGGLGGAILSTVFPLGGPFMGAMLGMAVNTLKKSETFNSFMFGNAIGKDKQGNTIRDESGILPSTFMKTINKYLPDMKKYGTVGTVVGLATPFGPLGGAMIGAAASIVKNNASLNRAIFGSGKDGQRGLLGPKAKEEIKKKLPHIALGAVSTMLLGPFGLLGNAVLGSGLGLLSTTENFKKFMLGPKDKDGIRRGGLAGSIRRHVIDPLKESMDDFKKEFAKWFRGKIFNPMAEGLGSIGRVVSGAVGNVSDWAQGKINDMLSGNNNTIAKFLGNRFNGFLKDIHEKGGIGKALVSKFSGGIAEKVAARTKKFGEKVEDFGYKHGMLYDDAQKMAKFFERKGIDDDRSKAVGTMAGMSDEQFRANNELLQMIQGIKTGAIDDDIKRLQTRQAELFSTEMEKMADAYGNDSRERAAIADFGRKFDSFKDFATLDHLTGPDQLKEELFKNTNISEGTKDKMIDEFIKRRSKISELQSRKEQLKNKDIYNKHVKNLMDALGYTGSQEEFLENDLKFLSKVSRAEDDQRNLMEWERNNMGKVDEDSPAAKQQKAVDENTKFIDENTKALQESIKAIKELVGAMTANDPEDKGYGGKYVLSNEEKSHYGRMNRMIEMATYSKNPEVKARARKALRDSGFDLPDEMFDVMETRTNLLNVPNDAIRTAQKEAKENGDYKGKELSTAEKIKQANGFIDTSKVVLSSGIDAFGNALYKSQVANPASVIHMGLNAYKGRHLEDTKATDNINNFGRIMMPFVPTGNYKTIEEYDQAKRDWEEAQRKLSAAVENHAFGNIFSGIKTGLSSMGSAMWQAGKESFKQKAKDSWANIKNSAKNSLFGSKDASGQVNGASDHGIPLTGAAATLSDAAGAGGSGDVTESVDAKGNKIKEVTTSEGDIITYGQGGQDGSWNRLSTKDNAAAEAKLQKKSWIQERIAAALEGIANKMGAPTLGEKEGQKKGFLDSIMDLLKAPLSFLGGALGAAGTMIGGWLSKHLWQPLKRNVSKFASDILKGVGKIGSGLVKGLMGILKKNKIVSTLLGIGGVAGFKLFGDDDDEDDKAEKVESVNGFNAKDHGLEGLSPNEAKLAQQALEEGRSPEDITNMIKKTREIKAKAKDKESSEAKWGAAESVGFLGGTSLGSHFLGKVGFGHVGAGVGGAIGSQIVNYAKTGEIDKTQFAIDAAEGYGMSRLGSYLWNKGGEFVNKYQTPSAAGETGMRNVWDPKTNKMVQVPANMVDARGQLIEGANDAKQGILAKLKTKVADIGSGIGNKFGEAKNWLFNKAPDMKNINVQEKIAEISSKVRTAGTTFVEAVSKFLPKGGAAALREGLNGLFNKILMPDVLKQALPRLLKQAAAATTGVGMVLFQAAFAVKGFLEGKNRNVAAKLFKVSPDKVTSSMEILSGIHYGIKEFIPFVGFLIDDEFLKGILLSTVGRLLGVTKESIAKIQKEKSEEEKVASDDNTTRNPELTETGINQIETTPGQTPIDSLAVEVSAARNKGLKESVKFKMMDNLRYIQNYLKSNLPKKASVAAFDKLADVLTDKVVASSKFGEDIADWILRSSISRATVTTAYMKGMTAVPITTPSESRVLAGVTSAILASMTFLTNILPKEELLQLISATLGKLLGVDNKSAQESMSTMYDTRAIENRNAKAEDDQSLFTRVGNFFGNIKDRFFGTNSDEDKAKLEEAKKKEMDVYIPQYAEGTEASGFNPIEAMSSIYANNPAYAALAGAGLTGVLGWGAKNAMQALPTDRTLTMPYKIGDKAGQLANRLANSRFGAPIAQAIMKDPKQLFRYKTLLGTLAIPLLSSLGFNMGAEALKANADNREADFSIQNIGASTLGGAIGKGFIGKAAGSTLGYAAGQELNGKEVTAGDALRDFAQNAAIMGAPAAISKLNNLRSSATTIQALYHGMLPAKFRAAEGFMKGLNPEQLLEKYGTEAQKAKYASAMDKFNNAKAGVSNYISEVAKTKEGADIAKNIRSMAGVGANATATETMKGAIRGTMQQGASGALVGAQTNNMINKSSVAISENLDKAQKGQMAATRLGSIVKDLKGIINQTLMSKLMGNPLIAPLISKIGGFFDFLHAKVSDPKFAEKLVPKFAAANFVRTLSNFWFWNPLILGAKAIMGFWTGWSNTDEILRAAKLKEADNPPTEAKFASGLIHAIVNCVPNFFISILPTTTLMELAAEYFGKDIRKALDQETEQDKEENRTIDQSVTNLSTEATPAEKLDNMMQTSTTNSSLANAQQQAATAMTLNANVENKEKENEYKEALKAKITEAIGQINYSIGAMLSTGVISLLSGFGSKLVEEVFKPQNFSNGIRKLQGLQSGNVDITSNIMNSNTDKTLIKSAYIRGTSESDKIFDLPIGSSTQAIKNLAGIITALVSGIPFLTGFISEANLKGLAIDYFGKSLGIDSASLNKLRNVFIKKQNQATKSSQQVSTNQAQASQGKANAMNTNVATTQSGGTNDTASNVAKETAKESKSIGQTIKDAASSAWQGVKDTASAAVDKVKSVGSSIKQGVSDAWNKVFGNGKQGTGTSDNDPWSQHNSAYKGLGFNTKRDTIKQSFSNSACGAMAVSKGLAQLGLGKFGSGSSPIDAANYILSHNGKEKDGGTYPSALQNYAKSKGADSFKVSNHKDALDTLDKGGVLLTMGKDSNVDKDGEGKTTAYGKNPHWITVTKNLGNGKVLTHDSDTKGPNNKIYNASDIFNHSSEMIGMNKGKGKSKPSRVGGLFNKAKNKLSGLSKYGRSKFGMAKGGSLDGVTEDQVLKRLMYVAAELAKKVGSSHPELFFAQLIHETGGPAKYIADNKKAGAGDDHNYGGFTWYNGMGEEFRGVARPANEGGYYATFDSDDQYIDMAYEKVYKPYQADIAKASTPEEFARVLKANEYYAAPESEYVAGLKGALNSYSSELKQIGNIDVSSLKTSTPSGTSGSTSSGSKLGGFLGAITSAIAEFSSIFNPFSSSDSGKNGGTPASPGGGQGTQVSGGLTGDGNTMHIDAQTGGNCTIEATRAMVKAYLDRDEPKRNEQFGWWNPTLESDLNGQWVPFGNSAEEKAKFENFIADHFAKKPGNPLFLYQTGGDGRNGSHPINAGQGDHATVIGRKLANGKYEHYDSAGGVVKEFDLGDIFDPSAEGNPAQGMQPGEGNSIVVPQIDPSRPIANWGGPTPTAGMGKFIKTGLGKLFSVFGRDKSTPSTNPTMWQYLKSKGLSNVAAAGVMGNFKAESSMYSDMVEGGSHSDTCPRDPSIQDDADVPGYGLPQFTWSSLKDGLIDYANSKNQPHSDWKTQIDYLFGDSRAGLDKSTIANMDASQDPYKAALIWHKEYEKSDDTESQAARRGTYAKDFFDTEGKGQVDGNSTIGGPSSGGSNGGSSGGGGLFGYIGQMASKIAAPIKAGWAKFQKALGQAFQNNPALKKISSLMFGDGFNPFDSLFGSSPGGNSSSINSGARSSGPIPNAGEAAKRIVEEARSHIGKPYVMGANGPDAYDCSSHAQTSYAAAGIDVPRTADVQHDFFKGKNALVDINQAQPGDMIFFSNTYCDGVSHVGIVTQPGSQDTIQICHASSSKGVIECGLSEWHIEHLTRDEGLPIGSLALAFPETTKSPGSAADKFTPEERKQNAEVVDQGAQITGITPTSTDSGLNNTNTSYQAEDPDDNNLYADIDTENPQIAGMGKRLLSKFGLGKNPFKFGRGFDDASDVKDYSFDEDLMSTQSIKAPPKSKKGSWGTPDVNFGIKPSDLKAAKFGMGFSNDPRSADYWLAKGYSMEEAMEKATEALSGTINIGKSTDKYTTEKAKEAVKPSPSPSSSSNSIADLRKQEEEAKKAQSVSMADKRKEEEKKYIAPNGLRITDNDINYLKANGYTEDQALELLKKDEQYTKSVAEIEDKKKYTAPNGLRYDDNDIKYLMNNGYTEEAAIEFLKKDKKYTEPVTEEKIKESWAKHGKTKDSITDANNKKANGGKPSGDPTDIKTWLAQGYSMEEAMEKASDASYGPSSMTQDSNSKSLKESTAEEAAKKTEERNERYTTGETKEEQKARKEQQAQEVEQEEQVDAATTQQQEEAPKPTSSPQINKAVNKAADATNLVLAEQMKTNDLLGQILAAIQGAVEKSTTPEKPKLNPNTGTKETTLGSTIKSILTALGGGSNMGIGDKFMMNATRSGNNQGDINNIIHSMNEIATR